MYHLYQDAFMRTQIDTEGDTETRLVSLQQFSSTICYVWDALCGMAARPPFNNQRHNKDHYKTKANRTAKTKGHTVACAIVLAALEPMRR